MKTIPKRKTYMFKILLWYCCSVGTSSLILNPPISPHPCPPTHPTHRGHPGGQRRGPLVLPTRVAGGGHAHAWQHLRHVRGWIAVVVPWWGVCWGGGWGEVGWRVGASGWWRGAGGVDVAVVAWRGAVGGGHGDSVGGPLGLHQGLQALVALA